MSKRKPIRKDNLVVRIGVQYIVSLVWVVVNLKSPH